MKNPLKVRCKCRMCKNLRPRYVYFWRLKKIMNIMSREMEEVHNRSPFDRTLYCDGFDKIHEGKDVKLMGYPSVSTSNRIKSLLLEIIVNNRDIETLTKILDAQFKLFRKENQK